MKHLSIIVLMCIFLGATLAGCDKAQQAIDAIDKAKALSDDFQKKAKGIIPGSDQKAGENNKGGSGDKGEKDDKGDKDD